MFSIDVAITQPDVRRWISHRWPVPSDLSVFVIRHFYYLTIRVLNLRHYHILSEQPIVGFVIRRRLRSEEKYL